MKNLIGAFTRFLAHITRDPVGMAGAVITTVSAILFLTLFGLEIVGFHGGPYLGILAFVVIPGLFLFGLAPDSDRPVARACATAQSGRDRRTGGRRAARLGPQRRSHPAQLPRLHRPLGREPGDPRARHLQGRRGDGLDAVLRAGLPLGDAARVHDLPALPARARALRRVPHRRRAPNWFVKSKLSGSWQLVSVAFDLYPRPIPVPVHNLRPARETCEQCHWPQKFVGDRFKVNTHYQEDEANTELKTVLRRARSAAASPAEASGSTGTSTPTTPSATARTRSARRCTRSRWSRKDGTREDLDLPGGRDAGRQEGDRVADDGLRRLPQPPDPHLQVPGAGARRGALREAHRPRPAVHPPRGARGPPGDVPERAGGTRRASRRRSRTSTRRATRRSRRSRRRPSPQPARRSATSGPGTSSRA